jgi:hypothetical protein
MERSSEGAAPPFTSRCDRERGTADVCGVKKFFEGPKCTSTVPLGQNVVPKVGQEGRVESFKVQGPERFIKVIRGSDSAVFYYSTPLTLSLYSLFTPLEARCFPRGMAF